VSLVLNLILVGLLALLAFLAIQARQLLYAVVLLGVYGFVLALEWAHQGAFDVAFTEAVIGAGAWTVFMIAALYRTGEHEGPEQCRTRLRPGAILAVLGLGAMLVLVTLRMPAWGDPTSPASVHVSPRYIVEAQAATATPNYVTAVLGDYRSLDTLIESAVVFTAAMATILILGMRRAKAQPVTGEEDGSTVEGERT
jgi:multicomponent Na+:H+ antiporter subunit B